MADNKRILIVEDDADIRMVEDAYLQSAGFETRIVTEGTAVASMLEREYFDLLLLDLMLPVKNGYEVCREIRDTIDIPILMVTARTEPVDKNSGLGIGADDYIAKPFDPAELVGGFMQTCGSMSVCSGNLQKKRERVGGNKNP